MNPIVKPTIHLIWLFGLFTLVSFISMHILTTMQCKDQLNHDVTPGPVVQARVNAEFTWFIAVLTGVCFVPLLPWMCIRNGKFHRDIDQNIRVKSTVISGVFIVLCAVQILILGLLCYPGYTNLFWGYYYTKSFFCDVAKENVPKMLPGRYTYDSYNCHIPAHEFHNFVFLIVYWYLVASIFHQLFKMAVTLLAIFNVSIGFSYRSLNFSFGNPNHVTTELPTISAHVAHSGEEETSPQSNEPHLLKGF
ncbi:hypothetical protein QR680_003878 [Steinernema hermaphroditum]|uniref:Uncharacterized protein n=1 Tax=Steinernema hermaphroditum TaxID=289476 RepID=A0AA39HMY5_9BILA|nr:hypothetical protein QR680_003878 [Steinernema hermaphroditum]